MNAMVPVNEPLLDGLEERNLRECIRTGWISSEGHLSVSLKRGLHRSSSVGDLLIFQRGMVASLLESNNRLIFKGIINQSELDKKNIL